MSCFSQKKICQKKTQKTSAKTNTKWRKKHEFHSIHQLFLLWFYHLFLTAATLKARLGRRHPNPMMSPTQRVDIVSTILVMRSGLEKTWPKKHRQGIDWQNGGKKYLCSLLVEEEQESQKRVLAKRDFLWRGASSWPKWKITPHGAEEGTRRTPQCRQ